MTTTITRMRDYDSPCIYYAIMYAGQLVEIRSDRRHTIREAVRTLHEWDASRTENESPQDRAYVERRLRDGYRIVGKTTDGRTVQVAHVAAARITRRRAA